MITKQEILHEAKVASTDIIEWVHGTNKIEPNFPTDRIVGLLDNMQTHVVEKVCEWLTDNLYDSEDGETIDAMDYRTVEELVSALKKEILEIE